MIMTLYVIATAAFAVLGFLLAVQEGPGAVLAVAGLFTISAGCWLLALRALLNRRPS